MGLGNHGDKKRSTRAPPQGFTGRRKSEPA